MEEGCGQFNARFNVSRSFQNCPPPPPIPPSRFYMMQPPPSYTTDYLQPPFVNLSQASCDSFQSNLTPNSFPQNLHANSFSHQSSINSFAIQAPTSSFTNPSQCLLSASQAAPYLFPNFTQINPLLNRPPPASFSNRPPPNWLPEMSAETQSVDQDPLVLVVSQWAAEVLPDALKRRSHRNQVKKVTLSEFRRWKQFMINPSNVDEKELRQLEMMFSGVDVVACVQRRLDRSSRRRRAAKKKAEIKGSSTIITSISHCLSQLTEEDFQPAAVLSCLPPVSTAVCRPVPLEKQSAPLLVTSRLKKMANRLQERLRTLTKLQHLRDIRGTQLRNQGKLFPEEMDEIFNSKIQFFRNEISNKISRCKDLEEMLQPKKKTKEAMLNIIEPTCHPIDTAKIPDHVATALFGPRASDSPNRWTPFYCQAQHNRTDFDRIRNSWNAFLTNSTGAEREFDADLFCPPSQLSATWQLPPSPEYAWPDGLSE